VPLSLQNRRVGDIAVVTCNGRIVEGAETASLQRHLNDVLVYGADIVLNLSDVSFIDSSGLGLLVRYVTRARSASGNLKLCGVDAHIKEVLRITKLNTLLETYDTEDEAIEDFYSRSRAQTSDSGDVPILCVEPSIDVLAYVRELLKQAGFSVLSVTNLPDALILLRAARPRLIVLNAELHALRSTHAAESFNALAATMPVVELPADIGGRDPAEAGQELLNRIRPILGGSEGAATVA
jgi:anti-anti-sigma factor